MQEANGDPPPAEVGTMNTGITTDEYFAQKDPRFGSANPERMDVPFWRLMVRTGWTAWTARMHFDVACREYMQRLKEVLPPNYQDLQKMSAEQQAALSARLPRYKYGGPVWSFARFGMSETELPDGSRLFVGGEHEDWYDPDFYIYNDVIVVRPSGDVEIYGYPRELFRPTDFHSATLVGDSVYLIGCLGYWGTQPLGETPVYRLDLGAFALEAVPTHGDLPGWIQEHQAVYDPAHHAIRIRGGKVLLRFEGRRTRRQNRKTYWLDLAANTWSSGRRR